MHFGHSTPAEILVFVTCVILVFFMQKIASCTGLCLAELRILRAEFALQNKALLDLVQRNHEVLLLGADHLNQIRQKLGLKYDEPPTDPRPKAGEPIN